MLFAVEKKFQKKTFFYKDCLEKMKMLSNTKKNPFGISVVWIRVQYHPRNVKIV